MRRPFSDVLDECLDRVLLLGEPVEACVADFPEYDAELREALEGALAFRQASAFQPDADRKRAARLRMLGAMETRRAPRAWRLRWPGFGWLRGVGKTTPRWAVSAAALVVLVGAGGTGTLMASQGSVPGDALYPVKRVSERARMMVTFSDAQEADLRVTLLDRRMKELEEVTEKGRDRFIPQLVNEIDRHSERVRLLAERPVRKVVDAASQASPPQVRDTAATPGPPDEDVAGEKVVRAKADRLLEVHYQLNAMEARVREVLEHAPN